MQPGEIRVAGQPRLEAGGDAVITIGLNTVRVAAEESNGLQLRSDEEFVIRIGSSALSPPNVDAQTSSLYRFSARPSGALAPCLFLDPSREWHPSARHGSGCLTVFGAGSKKRQEADLIRKRPCTTLSVAFCTSLSGRRQ